MEKHQFTLGAFAIVLNAKQEVLLCHRTDVDFWNLPGGGVDQHESPWDAVLREVYEETGLTVTVERLLGIYSKPQVDDLVFTFLCTPVDNYVPSTSNEADQVGYFALDQLPNNLFSNHLERIQDFFQSSQGVLLKKQ